MVMSNMSLKEFIAIVQAKIEEEPDPGRLEGLRKGERGTSTVLLCLGIFVRSGSYKNNHRLEAYK